MHIHDSPIASNQPSLFYIFSHLQMLNLNFKKEIKPEMDEYWSDVAQSGGFGGCSAQEYHLWVVALSAWVYTYTNTHTHIHEQALVSTSRYGSTGI